MVYLSILRGLPLGCLSIVIPKASTIRLRNSSNPIELKNTELSELEQRLPTKYYLGIVRRRGIYYWAKYFFHILNLYIIQKIIRNEKVNKK